LFQWNFEPGGTLASLPVLTNTVLSSALAADAEPAHLRLAVRLPLSSGARDARWLLAESSWADLFTPPRFLGVAQWIWKVSACLLVLQFVIPIRRHWHRARRGDDLESRPDELIERETEYMRLRLDQMRGFGDVRPNPSTRKRLT
jgi:hypothetical protein